jgi:hypothetical protein
MSSREKRLRIPAALAVVLLAPGLSCSSPPPKDICTCLYVGISDGGAIPDGGIPPDAGVGDTIACTGPDDPLFKDPLWNCIDGFV